MADNDEFEPLKARGKAEVDDSPIKWLQEIAREEITEALDTASETKEKLKGLEKELANSRNKNLETLAIFVALFTFASLTFQMFANVNKAFWVPLSCVLLGGLSLFCSILVGVSSLRVDDPWRRKTMPICFCVISIILIILGAILYQSALNKYEFQTNQCIKLANTIYARDALSTQQNAQLYNVVCKELGE